MSNEHTGDRDSTKPEEPRSDRTERTASIDVRLHAGVRPLTSLLDGVIRVAGGGTRIGDCAVLRRGTPRRETAVERTSARDRDRARRGTDVEADRGRTKRVRVPTSTTYLLDTRRAGDDGDEVVVTADIPGATVDELTVGTDPRTTDLVIARNESVIGRVKLPWSTVETTSAWFNNGILELRVREAEPCCLE